MPAAICFAHAIEHRPAASSVRVHAQRSFSRPAHQHVVHAGLLHLEHVHHPQSIIRIARTWWWWWFARHETADEVRRLEHVPALFEHYLGRLCPSLYFPCLSSLFSLVAIIQCDMFTTPTNVVLVFCFSTNNQINRYLFRSLSLALILFRSLYCRSYEIVTHYCTQIAFVPFFCFSLSPLSSCCAAAASST